MKPFVGIIAVMSCLMGCTSWRVTPAAPEKATYLRVTMPDGSQLLLHDAQPIGDSLVGFVAPQGQPFDRVRVAIPRGEPTRIERRRVNAITTSLVGVAVGAVIAFFAIIAGYHGDPDH